MKKVFSDTQNFLKGCFKHWDGLVFVGICLGLVGIIGYQLVPRPHLALVLDPPSPALLAQLKPPPLEQHQASDNIAVNTDPVVPVLEPITMVTLLEKTDSALTDKSLHPQANRQANKSYPAHPKKDLAHTPVISLNTATAVQFAMLPGIGEKTAQRILDYRRQVGKFSTLEQIMDVKGIGEKKFAKMKPFLKL